MAFANTATDVQILHEAADHAMVKLLRYVKTAADETDVKKVDAETLSFRTLIVTDNTAGSDPAAGGFPTAPSVQVHPAANANVTAYVVDTLSNGALALTSVVGTVQAGDELVCDRAGVGSLFSVNGVVTPVRQLDIESIWFSISGEASKVALEWGGYGGLANGTYSSSNVGVFTRDGGNTTIDTAIVSGAAILLGNGTKLTVNVANSTQFTTTANTPNVVSTTVQVYGYTTAMMLGEGSGYFGRNALQAEIVPAASANSDGSIYVSTYGMPNESMYDIVLELRKSKGFAQPTIY